MEVSRLINISEKDTPNMYNLMNQGINFTNMYACGYGSGLTFASEFASNTGIYQSINNGVASSLSSNSFPYSLPSIFNGLGYTSKSFHENYGTFYNRTDMHRAFGYEKYYETVNIVGDSFIAQNDESMILNDDCWNEMTNSRPFFNFLITYSAHVPYTKDDELVQYTLNRYPEYDVERTESEKKYYLCKGTSNR